MLAHLASMGLVSATGGYVRPPTDFGELADGRSAEVTNLAGETLATVPLNGQVFVDELKLRIEEALEIPPSQQRLSVASWDPNLPLPGWVLLEDAFPEPGVANQVQLLMPSYPCIRAQLKADAEEQEKRGDRLSEDRFQIYTDEVMQLHKDLELLWLAFDPSRDTCELKAPREEDLRMVVVNLSRFLYHVRIYERKPNLGRATVDLYQTLNDLLAYARHVFFQAEEGVRDQFKNLVSADVHIGTDLQGIHRGLNRRIAGMGTDFSQVSEDDLRSLETALRDLEKLILPGRFGSDFDRFWADA